MEQRIKLSSLFDTQKYFPTTYTVPLTSSWMYENIVGNVANQ